MAHVDSGCRMIIVGNKCDLEDKKEISEEKGRTLAEEYGFKFIEASAKTNKNVDDAFNMLVREIKNRMDDEAAAKNTQQKPEAVVGLNEEKKQKSDGCCGK